MLLFSTPFSLSLRTKVKTQNSGAANPYLKALNCDIRNPFGRKIPARCLARKQKKKTRPAEQITNHEVSPNVQVSSLNLKHVYTYTARRGIVSGHFFRLRCMMTGNRFYMIS